MTDGTNPENAIELQPLANQQPMTIQVVPQPVSNDHLFFIMGLMFVFVFVCCNPLGAICLMPALICATMVSPHISQSVPPCVGFKKCMDM